jgi:hypothetical protein
VRRPQPDVASDSPGERSWEKYIYILFPEGPASFLERERNQTALRALKVPRALRARRTLQARRAFLKQKTLTKRNEAGLRERDILLREVAHPDALLIPCLPHAVGAFVDSLRGEARSRERGPCEGSVSPCMVFVVVCSCTRLRDTLRAARSPVPCSAKAVWVPAWSSLSRARSLGLGTRCTLLAPNFHALARGKKNKNKN